MYLKKKIQKGIAWVAMASMCLSGLTVSASPGKEAAPVVHSDETGRIEISFNNDWRFYEGNAAGAEKPEYEDGKWLYVNTPHSTIQYTPENYYQKDLGIYWYRRHFKTPDTVSGSRRALLTFEGAMQQAEVWLNDTKLGVHQGGYTEFSFDITDALKTDGSENVLAVKLDTRPGSSFAPGKDNPDFQYFGGLYRNVSVTVTDPVRITDAVSSGTEAGGGVFLTSPEVSKERAVVKAKTEVHNGQKEAEEVTLITEILTADGQSMVASAESTQTVGAGVKHSFEQNLEVTAPRLWSTDTPELYLVRSTVKRDGAVCDTSEASYGIRKVEWKRDGCYLNGERVELVGTNLHSETYMLGNAISDDAIFAEVKRLREYGFNFIRMSHYPHAKAFYEACDQYGVAVLDCIAGWQYFNNSSEFKENSYQQIREMVRANRNYASVVAWEPSLNESGFNQEWAEKANAVTKAEYPEDGVSKAYTGGWKYWDVYDIGVGTPQANVVGDADRYSEKPVVVSEYGDWNMGGFGSSTRVTREPQHYSSAKGGDEGMLIQCDNIQSSLAYNRSKSNWYGAAAYWQYSDYAGFDTEKLTYCGVVDVARIPKFGAYFYQSQRDPQTDLSKYGLDSGPMVYIANTWASDSPNEVRVFSNCDEVALYLDDQLIAKQTPDQTMWDPRGAYSDDDYGKMPNSTSGTFVSTEYLEHPPFTFDLSSYTPGQGTLRAVAYLNGKETEEYICSAPQEATQITLRAENGVPLKLDGSTAKLVWVDVKDVNNTVVNTASQEITFTTEGPGFVIGQKSVSVRGGRWAVWVRSQRGSGDITLHASADGLKAASVTIPTVQVSGLPKVPEGGDADETGFIHEPKPENIFLNKKTSASSINIAWGGAEEKAEYANDGDESTKWCAKVTDSSDDSLGGHWWQTDLGMPYEISSMEIVFDTSGGYKYQIAVSDDPEFTDYQVEDHETLVESGGRVTQTVDQKGRYVRIYLNCPTSSIWPCLREVSGFGIVDNIAHNKTSAADGTIGGSSPANAVDGKSDTFWNKGGFGPGWWQVDLDGDYMVDEVSLVFAWAGTSDNGIIRHRFTLQSSMDGIKWQDIDTWSDLEQEDEQVNDFITIPVNAEARYLRVNDLEAKKQDGGQTQWIEIAEFIAKGKKLEDTVRLDYGAKTKATSNADGITPENGNDGNPQTFWIPAPDDANPSWQFDAAGLYQTKLMTLTWTTEAEHYYKVDISTDGDTWSTAADHMEEGKSGGTTEDNLSGLARYIRISVKPGTTDGFWINSTGRIQSPALEVQSTEKLPQIEGKAGISFDELKVPDEIDVTLTGDVKTTLPVTWDKESFDSSKTEEQMISGELAVMPGVQNTQEFHAEVKILLAEEVKPSLKELKVTPPVKTEYELNEKFDNKGMKVIAVYSDNSTKDVTEEAKVSGFDSKSAGVKTVKVEYESIAASFKVTVKEKLPEYISIKDADVTGVEESYDYTGKAIEPDVIVTLNGKNLKEDTDYTVTYKDNTEVGTAEVMIEGIGKYRGSISVSFQIEEKPSLKELEVTPPAKTEYELNEKFDAKGMKVTAVYSDNSTKDVTEEAKVSGFDSKSAGVKTVKVEYEGIAASFKVTVKEGRIEMPFTDVKDKHWYYKYVEFVYREGIMTGLKEDVFGASELLSRAQFAVILYRMEGKPEVGYSNAFPDVEEGMFYTDAVIWANENNIIKGYGHNKHFGPGDEITREQMAVIMYRYAEYKTYDMSQKADISNYKDAEQVSDFAYEALRWCVANKIISGMDEEHLAPQGTASRAHCAAIIQRFMEVDK